MSTTAEIRRQNLIALIEEFGTQDAVAALATTSQVYLSQLRTSAPDSKTGRPREIGARLARKLEQGCGKETGWMDVPHSTVINAGKNDQDKRAFDNANKIMDPRKPYIVQSEAVWPFTLFTYSDWLGLPAKMRESFEDEIAGAMLRHQQTASGT